MAEHGGGVAAAAKPGIRNKGGMSSIYQIDFTAVACGKRIATSKRRVRWRFGFTNMDALNSGETGVSCRGEEHDITLVWSITTGKRLVLADGQEVHYSNSRSSIFEFSWTMRGNHVLKVIAHASPPMTAVPGFRQYDFFVDGQSFFVFPKVYRLGLTGKSGSSGSTAVGGSPKVTMADRGEAYKRGSSEGVVALEAPKTEEEENLYLQEAIKNSLQENAAPAQPDEAAAAAPASQDNLLLDFFDAPAAVAPAPPPHAMAPVPQPGTATAVVPAPPSAAAYAPYPDFNSRTPSISEYSQPATPAAAANPFTNYAASGSATAYAPTPTPATAYPGYPVPVPAPAVAPATPFDDTNDYATPAPTDPPTTDPFSAPPPSTLSMNPSASTPATSAEAALGKLMSDFSLTSKKDDEMIKANPFDDSTSRATLDGMKTAKPEAAKKAVMQTTAMVPVATQGGNWSYGVQTQPNGYSATYSAANPYAASYAPAAPGVPPQQYGAQGYAYQQQPVANMYPGAVYQQPVGQNVGYGQQMGQQAYGVPPYQQQQQQQQQQQRY